MNAKRLPSMPRGGCWADRLATRHPDRDRRPSDSHPRRAVRTDRHSDDPDTVINRHGDPPGAAQPQHPCGTVTDNWRRRCGKHLAVHGKDIVLTAETEARNRHRRSLRCRDGKETTSTATHDIHRRAILRSTGSDGSPDDDRRTRLAGRHQGGCTAASEPACAGFTARPRNS